MCQETYLNNILECFQINHCKPIDTPVQNVLTLSLDQCPKTNAEKERMKDVPYASVVGSLMYAMFGLTFALQLVW